MYASTLKYWLLTNSIVRQICTNEAIVLTCREECSQFYAHTKSTRDVTVLLRFLQISYEILSILTDSTVVVSVVSSRLTLNRGMSRILWYYTVIRLAACLTNSIDTDLLPPQTQFFFRVYPFAISFYLETYFFMTAEIHEQFLQMGIYSYARFRIFVVFSIKSKNSLYIKTCLFRRPKQAHAPQLNNFRRNTHYFVYLSCLVNAVTHSQ